MAQPIEPIESDATRAGALVIHGDMATLFGPIGMPVPANARMGAAEAAAATVQAPAQAPRATLVANAPAFRLAGAVLR